ncbi:hypothetical protein LVJ94_31480 [Pendulispora rubella]|uniref:Peptide N-acetyl-beta-D-glucosaminyl asparaginase amidase A N-terminal domain-containing protein n=2 Tax=Pendulispora rubella TaxID=2741070 RepID=A0ABZ2KSC6_9BACT
MSRWTSLLIAVPGLFFAWSLPAHAGTPPIGSADTATADPPVARPRTTPCVVPLFANVTFANFDPKPFSYVPPSGQPGGGQPGGGQPGCTGPWAKIVLESDWQVTAGRQFDRTANMWIGGANVYFGTTSEPSRNVSRTWHVERDLTDYRALLSSAQSGQTVLGNVVNDTYTGIITGSARILFYPVEPRERAPETPDVVLPLSDSAVGGVVNLANGTSRLARTFTLPTNVERAYLDVIAQSQSHDEFWYTCVPDDVTGPLQSCGGGAFRETLVTIDGKPAGVAPVYPWLYTGAIDPYLWRPIVGVETLNFTPYRVDLTPFAGVLSDGRPHEVSIGVFGANDYFSTTGTLFLHLDHGAKRTKGQVLVNTLAADPSPVTTKNVQTASDGTVTGTVHVEASRRFTLAGWVDTSHGRVHTEIVQTVDFSNAQRFEISSSKYAQNIVQKTKITALTNTHGRGGATQTWSGAEWPLDLDYVSTTHADGTSDQRTTVDQRSSLGEMVTENGVLRRPHMRTNAVFTTNTLLFDAAGKAIGPKGQKSSQSYFERDLLGACYSRALESADGLLTKVTDGRGCR